MQPTIVFRHYELLVPLLSTETYTEHLVRRISTDRDGALYRLRLGQGARVWHRAPEVGVRIHPHVLAVVESGSHEGVDFVVYEHVHGVRLSEVLESGTMASRPECAIAVVLDGLRAAQAYRAWRFESRFARRSSRRPFSEDDVWIGADGITRLSVVDLPSDDPIDDDRASSLDVRRFGEALLALVAGREADDELGAARGWRPVSRSVALAELCARAIGDSATHRYSSSGEMSLALHRLAVAERLIAPVEAIGSLVMMSFSERLDAAVPRGERSAYEEDEPTLIGPREPFEAVPGRASDEAPVRDDASVVRPETPTSGEARRGLDGIVDRVRGSKQRAAPWQLATAALLGACVAAAFADSPGFADAEPQRPTRAAAVESAAPAPAREMAFSIEEIERSAAASRIPASTAPTASASERGPTDEANRDAQPLVRATPRRRTASEPARATTVRARPTSTRRNPYL